MRKVRCEDCGKVYDYDVDDFCPRCGSFNPPSVGSAGQPISRPAGQPVKPAASVKAAGETAPRTISYPSDYDGLERKKGGARLIVVIIALLAAIFVGVPLIAGLVSMAADAVSEWSDTLSDRTEPAPARPEGEIYESYETVTLANGQQISVGDGWEPWLPDEFMEEYPDTRCVAVGLWVLGEPGAEDMPLALVTEEGSIYMPEHLPDGVLEACGLDSAALADGTAEKEIFGYSFYFLPEDTAGQTLTAAVLDEESVYIAIDMEWE